MLLIPNKGIATAKQVIEHKVNDLKNHNNPKKKLESQFHKSKIEVI